MNATAATHAAVFRVYLQRYGGEFDTGCGNKDVFITIGLYLPLYKLQEM